MEIEKYIRKTILLPSGKTGQKLNMAISPNTIFQSGTTLLVLGEYKELQKCFRM